MIPGRGVPHAMRDFGMDTITLAGPLEAKLEAMQEAGFKQVMLKANDLVGHPNGWKAAVKAVRESGLRGIGIDSFHILAAKTPLEAIEDLDPRKIFLVQLSDFMWQETRTFEERMATARTFRVFPGEGVHTAQLVELVLKLDTLGYAGDYS